jgi:hypothetical protein
MALRYSLRIRQADAMRTAPSALASRLDGETWLARALGLTEMPAGVEFLRFSNLPWVMDSDGEPDELVVQIACRSSDAARAFVARLPSDARFGRDPRIGIADAWVPIGGDGGNFGNRAQAHAMISADALTGTPRGEGVNVAIVDMGVDRDWLKATRRRLGATYPERMVHGWSRYDLVWVDGSREKLWHSAGARPSEHGHMIARTVLSLVPNARIWDVPLVGDAMVAPGISTANAILKRIHAYVGKQRAFNGWRERKDVGSDEQAFLDETARAQPWVIVNAWGVFDTDAGYPGLVDRSQFEYGDDPDHFLIDDLPELEAAGMDVVFCAANCGEPCPDWRCGENDRGPGRSIMGLNAHPSALTVGAVRTDGVPIAQSSQGPGRLAARWAGSDSDRRIADRLHRAAYRKAAHEKPDLCAPSYFRDDEDESLLNRGTSAACAVAGGVLAALRSVEVAHGLDRQRRLSCADLRQILRDTARNPAGPGVWDPQLGYGVIDAAAALREVREHHGIR